MQRRLNPTEEQKDIVVRLILREMVKYCPVDKLVEQIITYLTEGKVPEDTGIDFNAFLILPTAGAHRVISNLIKINEPLPRARRTVAGKRYKKLFIVKKVVKRVNRKKLFIVKKYGK